MPQNLSLTISDPVTAIAIAALDTLTALLNALQTAQGQVWWAQNNQLVSEMWSRLGVHIPGGAQAPQAEVTVTKA